MDVMPIVDIALVGITESLLFFVFGHWMCSGRFMPKKNGVIKYLVAVVLQLCLVFFVRSIFTNICFVALTSLTSCTLIMHYVFKFNFRKAILSSLFIGILGMAFEVFVFPVYTGLLDYLNIDNFFKYRILLYIPIRIMQILAVIQLYRLNFHFRDHLLFKVDYHELDTVEKSTLKQIILALLASNLLFVSFIQLVVELKALGVNSNYLSLTLFMILISVFIHIFVTLNQLVRTFDYETKTHALNMYMKMLRKRREDRFYEKKVN